MPFGVILQFSFSKSQRKSPWCVANETPPLICSGFLPMAFARSQIENSFFRDFLTRLLAYTIYNPTVAVIPKWKLISEFELNEIKLELIKCVDDDDDILTQFIDSDQIKNHINTAESFEIIYNILLKYVFEYNDENDSNLQ